MATTRRNGQLSSCEPCRKSKLRCDHESPICGRCLTNNQAERCFYHPAPLTQPHARHSRTSSRRSRKQKRQDNQLTFRLDKTIPSTAVQAAPPDEPPVADDGKIEYEDSLHVEEPGCFPEATVQTTVYPFSGDNSDRILQGAQILSHLQKIRWYHEIIDLKNKTSPGWFLGPPMTDALCSSVERMYDSAVCGSQDTRASLVNLSRQIFANTSKEIRTCEVSDLSDYFDLISARWETIGLVFVLLGTALFHTADNDPVFIHRNPWKLAKSELRILLASTLGGSGNYSSPNFKLGDLSTIVYAFGLHELEKDLDESLPFFLIEIRKRVMVCAYAIDKDLATSLGRPPRICSRYCHLPFPLDLTYEEMILPPNEREKALLKLDVNGWNTEEKLTVGVRLRVVLLTSLLRGRILELSLSPRGQPISARVENLIQQSRQAQEDLPSFIRWSPEDAAAGVYSLERDESRAFAKIEFTYQEFLLHRILLKRLGKKSQGLIESSLEIITTLLDIIAMQTRSGKPVVKMSWDLCHMGLPAAGILTSKLLSERGLEESLPPSAPLPANFRSIMIQQLSIFISHLTSLVQPHEGNYDISQKGAKFIRWVLDQTLSPDVSHSDLWTADLNLPDSWGENLDMTDDVDFMAWCDDIQWLQDPLLSVA
ncbi:uncharacterized protein BO97DRAFT_469130 [Aspergillus homomorphus CBS 101889]|uniref:Zn(2)-C6 fungal-type domain-containing protein n=1 Tax=Aspergillus homomorphus (strain CBS 101889) TaxID=1450537 RepID=A0A395I256_ASPHC|nr:hypothetical protein BO97DRAFT_469130 [Aspergillus homomorphus CBS 101889]RAL14251.1 hypothetical protein BO97DRAFT_469130 [Aspergillus homomorphus CBS 101889]